MRYRTAAIAAACLFLASGLATASAQSPVPTPASTTEDEVELSPVVVTGQYESRPLEIVLDARAPAQPIPAQDGADILKTVPGFSVSRKGGAGGEVVLRGQAGSRLDIQLDGTTALGGCPHRMDPPTAYVFPESFETVTVIKGPQTVIHGPGYSAGVVLFESEAPDTASGQVRASGALTFGSFGRNDQSAEVVAGLGRGYVRANGVRTASDDYEDGDGTVVHSHYERSIFQAAAGWTPDRDTLFEVSGGVSEGEAAYGHGMMDASVLDRENLGLRFRRTNLSPLLTKIEAQLYQNNVDHVMDDYSLRTFVPSMMGPNPSASNPDHRLTGGRFETDLAFGEQGTLAVGIDARRGVHRSRSTGNQPAVPYLSLPRVKDAEIGNVGLFAEFARTIGESGRFIAGARIDSWQAHDFRATIPSMMGMAMPNPTADLERDATLGSGFLRYEHAFAGGATTAYAGVGLTERAPDYWELVTNQSEATRSSFLTDSEKTTQLDFGVVHRSGPLTASVSGFVGDISDFILVQSGWPRGMSTVTVTRNVDATTAGAEASLNWAATRALSFDASLAYVTGDNDTDDLPLAQQPPLEVRLGTVYRASAWSVGALVRVVSEQDRVAPGQGTIIGQDIGPTDGFEVFSLNASWRVNEHARLSAGIDNIFDTTYAEHISRAGGMVEGYVTTTRINEPGRNLWIRAELTW
ncbi:MAG: TonB-dependent copper receptor [Opitutaceae bacterium]|nr:TonB-dependent copper receptor [Opitutaceae bacterium]